MIQRQMRYFLLIGVNVVPCEGTFNRWTAKATAQPGPDISEQIALLSNGNQPTSFSAGFEVRVRMAIVSNVTLLAA